MSLSAFELQEIFKQELRGTVCGVASAGVVTVPFKRPRQCEGFCLTQIDRLSGWQACDRGDDHVGDCFCNAHHGVLGTTHPSAGSAVRSFNNPPAGSVTPGLVQSSTKEYPDTELSGGRNPKHRRLAVDNNRQVRNLVRGSREAVKEALSSNQGRLDALKF